MKVINKQIANSCIGKLLFAIFIFTGFTTFAQTDLSITQYYPTNGFKIRSGQVFIDTVIITNEGFNSIDPWDSINIIFSINGVLQTGTAFFIQHSEMTPGFSAKLGVPISITHNAATNVQFCALLSLRYDVDIDQITTNNFSCITSYITTGIDEISFASQSVKLYPNPANDMINFSIDGNVAKKINILDITGRIIEVLNIDASDTHLNISEYSNGIYIYQIISDDGEMIKSGKFNVSK